MGRTTQRAEKQRERGTQETKGEVKEGTRAARRRCG
jgi:hypothetical protein